MKNYMKLEIAALSENESFARSTVAAFALVLNPFLSELSDIKTAVSEAVTNCVVHAYREPSPNNKILLECEVERLDDGQGGILHICVTDYGCGIQDVDKAIEPFYTTLSSEERSGMGFTIMQTFMDDFTLLSTRGEGTHVRMSKRIGGISTQSESVESVKREGVHA